ncbi:MAG: DUF192 domain-containing protein, partial [Candidatus Omnitrophica bacterium]|nr:DUF192 domain-containing protein [Candidatus Omnitrophota bacterium]
MTYTIKKKGTDQAVVANASVADNFILRLLGLMFRESIDPDEGLIFYNAPSIHMFCMRFPIDVVFLDKNHKIIKISHSLKPWR